MKNYVKEYKGFQVPEWATHVSDFPTPQPIEFYRAIGGEHQFFNTGAVNPVWCKSVFNEPNKWEIELPEAPQEWMPEIGEECEYESIGHHDGFEWCIFQGLMSDGAYIIEYHHHTSPTMTTCCPFDPKLTTFRPLKTQREKEREAFIDSVNGVFSDGEFDRHDLVLIAAKLFEERFTAPKAANNDK